MLKEENINETNPEQSDNEEFSAPSRFVSSVYDGFSIFLSALCIIAFIFTFIFRFVGVQGDSMFPTLNNGDWLIVQSISSDFKQGDIVISTQPNAFNEPIVKRVIATGGQTVDIDFNSGTVYVDGEALNEDYIAEPTYSPEGVEFPIVVPENSLFLMGDNRNDSTDSRSPAIGCVDERYILGVVRFRATPNFTKF